MDQLVTLNQQYIGASTVSDSNNIKVQIETVFGQLSVSVKGFFTASENYRNGQLSAVPSIEQLNNAIVPNSIFDDNEKLVNGVYLATVARGVMTFTGTQLTTLENIVFQCPWEGGAAVHKARMLYNFAVPTEFDDEALCGQVLQRPEQSVSLKVAGTTDFTIYPNPTKDLVMVSWGNAIDGKEKHIELYSNFGRLVRTIKVPEGSGSLAVPVNDLPNGVYLCRVYVENERHAVGKFLIAR